MSNATTSVLPIEAPHSEETPVKNKLKKNFLNAYNNLTHWIFVIWILLLSYLDSLLSFHSFENHHNPIVCTVYYMVYKLNRLIGFTEAGSAHLLYWPNIAYLANKNKITILAVEICCDISACILELFCFSCMNHQILFSIAK